MTTDELVGLIQAKLDDVQGRIAGLDIEREELQKSEEMLKDLLQSAGVDVDGEGGPADEKPAKKRKKKTATAAEGNGKPQGNDTAVAIARAIAKSGPMTNKELVAATGFSLGGVGKTLRESDWFQKTGEGKQRDPWELTEAGKAAEVLD